MAKAIRRAARRVGIMGELMQFLWVRKLWWMTPMVVILLLLGIVIIFAQSSAIAPFIYTLF
jgi:hypothetical protein